MHINANWRSYWNADIPARANLYRAFIRLTLACFVSVTFRYRKWLMLIVKGFISVRYKIRNNLVFKTAIRIAFELAPIFQGFARILRARFLNHDWWIVCEVVFCYQEIEEEILKELRRGAIWNQRWLNRSMVFFYFIQKYLDRINQGKICGPRKVKNPPPG